MGSKIPDMGSNAPKNGLKYPRYGLKYHRNRLKYPRRRLKCTRSGLKYPRNGLKDSGVDSQKLGKITLEWYRRSKISAQILLEIGSNTPEMGSKSYTHPQIVNLTFYFCGPTKITYITRKTRSRANFRSQSGLMPRISNTSISSYRDIIIWRDART